MHCSLQLDIPPKHRLPYGRGSVGKNQSRGRNFAGYQPKPVDNLTPCHNAASPGYLATLDIPLMAGRDFSPADAFSKNKVALVNESFARKYFGPHSPRSEEHTSELQSLRHLVCRL